MQLHQGYLLSVGKRYFLVRGKTQGDSIAMGSYALGILLLIKLLLEFVNLNEMNAKEGVFAAPFSVASSLNSIKGYCEILTVIGREYGYFLKSTIVKEKI